MERPVLTVQEAMKLTLIGENSLYRLIRENKFPHIKIGNRILVPYKPMMEWLEQQAWDTVNSGERRKNEDRAKVLEAGKRLRGVR